MMRFGVVHMVDNLKGVGASGKAIRIFARTLDPSIFQVHVCGLERGGVAFERIERDCGLKVFGPESTATAQDQFSTYSIYGVWLQGA